MGKHATKALSLKLTSERSCFKALSFKRETKDVNDVRQLAMYLSDKMADQKSLPFYLKCAWRLPKAYLVDLAERSPSKYYFYACASREMKR